MPFTYGESPYGSELPPWRGYVEATVDATAPEGGTASASSTAQSSPAATGDGDVDGSGGSIAQSGTSSAAQGEMDANGAGIIEATATTTADGAASANGSGIAMYVAAVDQAGATVAHGLSVAQSHPDVTGDGAVVGSGGSMAFASFGITAQAEPDIVAAKSEAPPLFTPEPLGLAPLANSWNVDVLDAEFKQLVLEMFEQHLRTDERYVNVLGAPHLGPRELIEQSLAADGLSIYRGSTVGSNAGAYLLRSWRARNPKRGLHLLKTYLQLLWPNVWTAEQMWQEKGEPYPTALVPKAEADRATHYQTSRVNVTLPARATTGADLNSISSGLRASVPARIVLNLAIVTDERYELGMAAAANRGVVGASFEGVMS